MDLPEDFDDVHPDARPAVAYVWQEGIFQGYPDGLFKPKEPLTREEAAILVHRLSWEVVLTRVRHAVPQVQNLTTGATGSGVHIGNGFILTNQHVVEGSREEGTKKRVGLQFLDKSSPQTAYGYAEGYIIVEDAEYDLAAVKLMVDDWAIPHFPFVVMGDVESLTHGDPVAAIGAPMGLRDTCTFGYVSNPERVFKNYKAVFIQTDAAINPGNSGGALVDRLGRLVGINTMKVVREDIEGIGFAVRVDSVGDFVRESVAKAGDEIVEGEG